MNEMILIQNTLFEGMPTDILIEGSSISSIGKDIEVAAASGLKIIDGRDTAVFPTFGNGHTHSPMVLLRGYGDDMLLQPWLEECIWPVEALYQEREFKAGYRLAFMEMVSGGTTAFNEMYMHPEFALDILREFPMKARLGFPLIDGMNEELGKAQIKECEHFFAEADVPEGVTLGLAIHSIYATSEYAIKWARDFSEARGLNIQIHLSETEQEVNQSKAVHHGMSPVEYLDSIDFLNDRVFAAHTVWLSDRDMDILADRGVTVTHNPVSNMKLASGQAFPFSELKQRGIPMMLGTDGASSNNNLDMLEEMKVAALLQKHAYRDPTRMTAEEIFSMATRNGAEALGTGGGRIAAGMEADLMLIDLDTPEMVPATNLISNMVYSATRSCVKTVLCGGHILMENRVIEGARECRMEAAACTKDLLARKVNR